MLPSISPKVLRIFILCIVVIIAFFLVGIFFSEIFIKEIKQDIPLTSIETIKKHENSHTGCIDTEGGTPVIEKLSQYHGTNTSQFRILGCNFSGFEGDLDAWIENKEGKKGYLRGIFELSTKNEIVIELTPSICTKNTFYNDEPCNDFIDITPGMYQIYTAPWGKESNKIEFKIYE